MKKPHLKANLNFLEVGNSPLKQRAFVYIDYLGKLRLNKFQELSAKDKKIIDIIFVNTKNGVFWTITQYLSLKELGSPATIHHAIHRLIKSEYLDIVFINGNRNKTVILNNKGNEYIAEMSKILVESVS